MILIERDINGRKISFETGRIAKQAGGSVLVRCGDTIVHVAVCVGKAREGIDFFPLSVEYQEKTYAAGRIPGGFFKREGRLAEREILICRLMDRPCRPMFPEGYFNEVQIISTVLSVDPEIDPDVLAVNGASAALCLSEAPFQGPIGAVRVGRINGKLVINPLRSELARSDINMIVAGSKTAIVMVEGGAQEVSEPEVMEALFFAHKELQTLISAQEELAAKGGKPKEEFIPPLEIEADLVAKAKAFIAPQLSAAFRTKEKLDRRAGVSAAKEALFAEFVKEGDPEIETTSRKFTKIFEDLQYALVREMIVNDKIRLDGRDFKTVRPISIESGFLPRTHGSALFTRGETQAIVVATLGTRQEAQRLDNLGEEDEKTFMLHYNFPPYSVGETKRFGGPGRREIGHGALAERAVKAVLPTYEDFGYVMRIVSEITESNGSSSMATVCGSSIALMDAGVPIKTPVAGVAMGLIKEGSKFVVLTDILGDEDHLGDMDFKVCGTSKGITALQMDIKISGLDRDIMDTALSQAKEARLHVLEKMNEVLAKPRKEMSRFAPRITAIQISTEKIKDLIGPGGKTIKSIIESCNVKVDVDDKGIVRVSSMNPENSEAAIRIIKSITEEAEIGKIYRGVVKRIADFGAFVEILPGTDGLVHISQLADARVNRVEDIVQEGDEVMVKVLEIDRQGKIRLSLKDALAELAGGNASSDAV